MKICFLGDSITEGYLINNYEDTYVSKVGKMLVATTYNCGISGTRIARTKFFTLHRHDLDFNLRIDAINFETDYLFIFGGTNDYGHGNAEIGNTNDTDVFTFCGAVNSLIDKALTKVKKDKLVFMLPLKRFNQNVKPESAGYKEGVLINFVEALKQILIKRQIKFIDLYNLFDEPQTSERTEFFIDGLHPTELGHTKIAEKIVEFIKNDNK